MFRAHFAMAEARGRTAKQFSTKAGMPTTALYVFSAMLIKLAQEDQPAHWAMVFDAPGKTHRDALFAEYKAHREAPPEELVVQMPWFPRIAEAMGMPVLSVPGVEADDVIATLVRQARARGWQAVVHSSDKDLMQLVGEDVVMYDSLRNNTYDVARVTEKFGVPPAQVAEVLALQGDTSDNVPGVTGVGPGWARKLIEKYGDVEGVLAHVAEIKGAVGQHLRDEAEVARLSRKLVTLDEGVALPVTLDDLARGPLDRERLAGVLAELEFGSLLTRIDSGTRAAPGPVLAERTRIALHAPPFPVLRTAEELAAAIAAARAAGRVALTPIAEGNIAAFARLIGIALAWPGAAPVWLPLGHRTLTSGAQLAETEALRLLGPLLTDAAVPKVAHDLKLLHALFGARGFELLGAEADAMLEAFLCDPAAPSAPEEIAKARLDQTLPSEEAFLGKGKSTRAPSELEPDEVAGFAAPRAEAALVEAPLLLAEVDALGLRKLHDEVELPLARVLAIMERTGVAIDVSVLERLGADAARELARIERELAEIVGREVNPQSPKQLAELLFGVLGLPVLRKTKTGPSTDAEVLEELATMHPAPAKILEHREIAKLKGTYLDALPRLVSKDGRLRTSYQQAVAATGRISSQEPNLQNVPIRTALGRQIRRAFVAPPGMRIVAADYSQIELRVLAHLSKDPVLVEAFATGEDVHARTAREVFGVAPELVTPEMRRVAKAVNFGVIYGQSDFGLARALGIPRGQAKTYIEGYFERYAGVRRFMTDTIEQAREQGVVTTLLGRRRPLPELRSKRFNERSYAERIARNTPIQGTAADLLKLAMIRMQHRIERDLAGARMVLTVHDELVFEVPEALTEHFASEARAEMQGVFTLAVPLQVDLGSGPTWAEAH